MNEQPWLDTPASAVDLAIEVEQHPGRHRALLAGRGVLPDDVFELIRLALEAARADDHGRSDARLRAALYFVEHVLLAEGADHYRVLGLTRGCAPDAVRQHYRLMMSVFHPDRSGWLIGDREDLAARINLAYQVLRTPARRAALDLELSRTERQQAAPPKASPIRAASPHPAPPVDSEPAWKQPGMNALGVFSALPPFVRQNLPQFVLGATALIGAIVVFSAYMDRSPSSPSQRPRSAVETSAQSIIAAAPALEPSPTANTTPEATPERETPPAPGASVAQAPKEELPEPVRTEPAEAPPKADDAPPTPPVATRLIEPPPSAIATAPLQPSSPASRPQAKAPSEPPPKTVRTENLAAQAKTADAVATRKPAPTPEPRPMVSAEPKAPPAAAAPQPLAWPEAAEVLRRLLNAYSQGDMDRFMSFFADNAKSNSGGLDAIRSDYRNLFETTASRSFRLDNIRWHGGDTEGSAEGRFEVRVHEHNSPAPSIHRGTVRFDFLRHGDSLKIKGMFHQPTS